MNIIHQPCFNVDTMEGAVMHMLDLKTKKYLSRFVSSGFFLFCCETKVLHKSAVVFDELRLRLQRRILLLCGSVGCLLGFSLARRTGRFLRL